MKTSFYTYKELQKIGFKALGTKVLISRNATIYSPEEIIIGDNVRVDDFCILSGNITIGSNIHISAFVAIYGRFGVILEDYTGLSPRSTVYSAMDDFSGEYLIGPVHDSLFTNVTGGLVKICKFSQIGANSIIFPNLTIEEGVVVGALSLVKNSLQSWSIYAGIPVKKIKDRSNSLLNLIKNG